MFFRSEKSSTIVLKTRWRKILPKSLQVKRALHKSWTYCGFRIKVRRWSLGLRPPSQNRQQICQWFPREGLWWWSCWKGVELRLSWPPCNLIAASLIKKSMATPSHRLREEWRGILIVKKVTGKHKRNCMGHEFIDHQYVLYDAKEESMDCIITERSRG